MGSAIGSKAWGPTLKSFGSMCGRAGPRNCGGCSNAYERSQGNTKEPDFTSGKIAEFEGGGIVSEKEKE